MTRRDRRWLELALISLIAVLLLWQISGVYQRLLLQAQIQALQLQADSFRQSLRAAHTLWRLQVKPGLTMTYDSVDLQFTASGWPRDAQDRPRVQAGGAGNARRCHRLWQGLMQYQSTSARLWRVQGREVSGGICRYFAEAGEESRGYFDYDQISGEVTLVLPDGDTT
ncbi:hypothetical protein [Gilvimarinus sp. DA14]|uniref:hypothetical protein n=1 Tax=Gilvimarinus sp. DA14 TaxID=2956798 RepID=UPI0020B75B8E|nr:hypothetical protein [Gilvimarinus sp. DA14]UTF61394.1 hypothetical protein NHM04_06250 [Gilvimarinus sp. DA14]